MWENKVVLEGVAIAGSTKSIEDWKEARDKCALQGVNSSHKSP